MTGDDTPRSIYQSAAEAAAAWQAELVGRLGKAHADAARAEWNRDRFWLWAIERAIEHVEGRAFWHECGRRNYSRASQRPELNGIIRRVRTLMEQLNQNSLPSFRAKETRMQEIADLANRILE
jgi:hypothetical protein